MRKSHHSNPTHDEQRLYRKENDHPGWLRRQLLAGGLLSGIDALAGSLVSPTIRFVWATSEDLFTQILRLTPEITSNAAFYKVSKNLLPPTIRLEQWSLRVAGVVRHPFNLHYADLLGFLPASTTQRWPVLATNRVVS